MKMSQLKMVIREVVREEIRMGLKEVLGGVKKQPVQKSKPPKKQQYSKNPVLNEMLNETASDEWETMGGTQYTSERMNELVGGSSKNDVVETKELSVDGQTPDFLKKDYRQLMDAVDKKQQQKTGG